MQRLIGMCWTMCMIGLGMVLAFATGVGCGDPSKLPVGGSCLDDAECISGFCTSSTCLDPAIDSDGDGLINGVEDTLGTHALKPDTDDDGVGDVDEITNEFKHKDFDQDGVFDALESSTADADIDCLPDEYDAEDAIPNGDLSPLVPILCPSVGVCVEVGATLAVSCPPTRKNPICEYGAVPGYEATNELSCDGRDNNCDGSADEGLDCDPLANGLIAWYALDGDAQDSGPNAHHGAVVGALTVPDRMGHAGKALRFSAAGDLVFASLDSHPRGDVSVTYAAWVLPEVGRDAASVILAVGTQARDARSALLLTGGRACATYDAGQNETRSASACAPAGHWSHLVAVKTGNRVTHYLNGRGVGQTVLRVGQSVVETDLVVGVGARADAGLGAFRGSLDELRLWGRALSDSEVESVYLEGVASEIVGTEARPGASCLHVRDGAPAETVADGVYWLDPDGDSPSQPFEAYCDMTLDGGGWTLAWVYQFTDPAKFDAESNAVTPRPTWPVSSADVPTSTTAPSGPGVLGAIDFEAWPALGAEMLFTSDLLDTIACEPGQGSLVDQASGDIDCRVLVDSVQTCNNTLPRTLDWGRYGPSLSATSLYLSFDGSSAANFPTHDPCGRNGFSVAPSSTRGAVWLRPSDVEVKWAASCALLAASDRSNGTHTIDLDGSGGAKPVRVECRFDLERGGWTRLSAAVAAAIATDGPGVGSGGLEGERNREYFYVQDDRFYRSPVTRAAWNWDTFNAVPGTWFWGAAQDAGTVACDAVTPAGAASWGVGCGANEGLHILPQGPRSAAGVEGVKDETTGETYLCEAPPGVFTAPTPQALCVEATEVWVRSTGCSPDQPGSTGDGSMELLAGATGQDDSPCWTAFGPSGFMDGFEASDDVRPSGKAPSLKVTNSEIGNLISAYQLTQTRLTVIAGRIYRVVFWAKASVPRTVRVLVQNRDSSHAFGTQDVALTSEWAEYTLTLTADRTSWNVMLNFQFAEVSTEAVWLDDVAVVD